MFKKECETGSYKRALKQAKTPEQVAEEEKYKQAGIDKCESNRKEWLGYYTEKGDYRKAEECCVEPAEYEAVAAKKEEDRKAWLKYAIETADYKSAEQYAVDEAEAAEVAASKAAYPEVCRSQWRVYYLETK